MAREVGTEGKLGGQAGAPGVAGTWKDLTDTVDFMAANLTEQVRGIVKVVTAVANGDLKQNLTVKSKGEVAALADTINYMTETLATFADQVTSVAREVGVEGELGGQANVPGASGTWNLTGNVNLLAANLTSQVRAIAEVATAVTKGDLTRSIQSRCARRSRGAEGQHQHDDRQSPADDAAGEHRAGLAENEPGAVHQHAAGIPARSVDRRPAAPEQTAPLISARYGRDLSGRKSGEPAICGCFPAYANDAHPSASHAIGAARRRADRPVRAGQAPADAVETSRSTRCRSIPP